MYLCVLEQCEWLQQQTFYTDKEQCKKVLNDKVNWYKDNTQARVEGICVDVFVTLKDPNKAVKNDKFPQFG
jgi:YbbR domain-containing protein